MKIASKISLALVIVAALAVLVAAPRWIAPVLAAISAAGAWILGRQQSEPQAIPTAPEPSQTETVAEAASEAAEAAADSAVAEVADAETEALETLQGAPDSDLAASVDARFR